MIIAIKPPVSNVAGFLSYFKKVEENYKISPLHFFLFETKFINGFQFVKYEVLVPKFFWIGLIPLLIYPFVLWKWLLVVGVILYLPIFFWSESWIRFVIWLGLNKAEVKGYKVVKLDKAIDEGFFKNESE